MSVQDSHYIWRHFFSAIQIIVRELLTAATIVIGLSAMSALLHWPRLGLTSGHVAVIEAIHFWYSVALMVLFPARSLWEITALMRSSQSEGHLAPTIGVAK